MTIDDTDDPDDPKGKVIAELQAENLKLKQELEENKKVLQFLSKEQIKNASVDRKSIKKWSNKSVTDALKLRFALGKFGYDYLRSTGYPTPSYSTLNRRMQCINMDFGILSSILNAMKSKVTYMSDADRWCALMVDEMEIASNKVFDVSENRFVGGVSLGSKDVPGKHYTVVLVRGLKSQWKQVIAHEITGPTTSGEDMFDLISRCILACQQIGLIVKAIVSDMGSNNKALWKELDVGVTKHERKTSFLSPDTTYVVADVPHLLKNLRTTTLSRPLILPKFVCTREGLSSRHVTTGCIKDLWISETSSETSLRSLHHLSKEHLFPTQYGKMSVAVAVQLFSTKTAAALEKSVRLRVLNDNVLTTAWWIRFIQQWFSIMTARHIVKGITINNKNEKFEFLRDVIDIVQNMQLGAGWKPLQTGIIMSTLSVIELADEAFQNGFKFFLPGRLTQDALENVFSQVRRKAGMKPTALKARMGLKLICISQFITDLKGTNYAPENDFHLFDLAEVNNDEELQDNINVASSSSKPLSASQENDVFYMAGATLKGVLQQKLCENCIHCAQNIIDPNEPNLPEHLMFLTQYSDMGGLSYPTSGIYRICREAERVVQHHKEQWVKDEIAIADFHINLVKEKIENIIMPSCCNLKEKIIQYYLVVRCKGIQNHLKNKSTYSPSYSSVSALKKVKCN